MTESKICTCPSGDGSLRWPCPAHPAVDQADVAAKLTFINGRPAMCGCQVEYSDGGGEYSDVIYVTLCAKHSGSAILDLVATNRIALTPEYEGQWHADLYLDREIPLAKVEGATPAEAVLALMSAERIDPEQESVEQAGGDERAADEKPRATRCPDCGEHDLMPGDICACGYETDPATGYACSECDGSGEGCVGEVCRECDGSGWFVTPDQARAALAQPSPKCATCNGTGLIDDGDITCSEGGIPYENGPVKCVKDCPDCKAQPTPLQSEQAEAERPEVAEVAFVLRNIGAMDAEDIDGDNVDLRFEDAEGRDTGCDVSIVEYAEKAADLFEQHDRIVGELRADRDSWAEQAEQRLADWDEMRKERDAALARVAELAQALRHLLHNIKASGKRIDLGLAKECAEDALARIDSTVAAQAQHSGPEEFSFEYRHPNGESHTVTVSRDQVINEMPDFLFEALCSKFCNCEPAGETNVVECCCDEYAEEFKLLAAAPAQAQHSVPEGWMLVPVEPLLNMMSDKDHDTRITAERQLLSILAAAPGKEVGHE
ncbi:hypothetical protein ACRXNU_000191 [Pseudomonas aeruginosa]